MLLSALTKGPSRIIGYHDKDSTRLISITLRPDAWAANTVYQKPFDFEYDAVLPTVFKGLYFRVKYPGKSGATDPFTGSYKAGDTVTDGTVTWEAVNYNLMPIGVNLSSISYVASGGVTATAVSSTQTKAGFIIPPLPYGFASDSFTVTMHITYSNDVIDDRTIKFKVSEK